jgi:hypothetical protein
MRRQPGFSEAMRAFLLRDVLSDPELAAEMDAGKGAAHFNMQQYQVSMSQKNIKTLTMVRDLYVQPYNLDTSSKQREGSIGSSLTLCVRSGTC